MSPLVTLCKKRTCPQLALAPFSSRFRALLFPAMPLPPKVQDTLARSLNNLTVVSYTALQELAQTVPTRQADKLQLLLNKLLERAELEASSSQPASSSGANLGPDSSSAPALDVVHILEALDAAGGGLANDDIEQLAADPAPSLSPSPAQAPADASASGNDPPPGLQSYDPAASGGHDQSASLGPVGWLERSAAWAS